MGLAVEHVVEPLEGLLLEVVLGEHLRFGEEVLDARLLDGRRRRRRLGRPRRRGGRRRRGVGRWRRGGFRPASLGLFELELEARLGVEAGDVLLRRGHLVEERPGLGLDGEIREVELELDTLLEALFHPLRRHRLLPRQPGLLERFERLLRRGRRTGVERTRLFHLDVRHLEVGHLELEARLARPRSPALRLAAGRFGRLRAPRLPRRLLARLRRRWPPLGGALEGGARRVHVGRRRHQAPRRFVDVEDEEVVLRLLDGRGARRLARPRRWRRRRGHRRRCRGHRRRRQRLAAVAARARPRHRLHLLGTVALTQAGDPRHLLGLRVGRHRGSEQLRRRTRVAGVLDPQHRVGDEAEVLGVDLDRPLVDPHRLLDTAVLQHQLGDGAVGAQRLVPQLPLLVQLGELQMVRRVVGLELDHLEEDVDGRRVVVVLEVVVAQHLVLGARLVDQALLVVERGEALVHRQPRRVELDDLLVDRDRFDQEAVFRVLRRDLREQPHRLVDARDAGVEVPQTVQRRNVVGVLLEYLEVLLDGGVDPPLGDVLLGDLDDLLALGHRVTSNLRAGPCRGSGPLSYDSASLARSSRRS